MNLSPLMDDKPKVVNELPEESKEEEVKAALEKSEPKLKSRSRKNSKNGP